MAVTEGFCLSALIGQPPLLMAYAFPRIEDGRHLRIVGSESTSPTEAEPKARGESGAPERTSKLGSYQIEVERGIVLALDRDR
jgi:hypothetical protein